MGWALGWIHVGNEHHVSHGHPAHVPKRLEQLTEGRNVGLFSWANPKPSPLGPFFSLRNQKSFLGRLGGGMAGSVIRHREGHTSRLIVGRAGVRERGDVLDHLCRQLQPRQKAALCRVPINIMWWVPVTFWVAF